MPYQDTLREVLEWLKRHPPPPVVRVKKIYKLKKVYIPPKHKETMFWCCDCRIHFVASRKLMDSVCPKGHLNVVDL